MEFKLLDAESSIYWNDYRASNVSSNATARCRKFCRHVGGSYWQFDESTKILRVFFDVE